MRGCGEATLALLLALLVATTTTATATAADSRIQHFVVLYME